MCFRKFQIYILACIALKMRNLRGFNTVIGEENLSELEYVGSRGGEGGGGGGARDCYVDWQAARLNEHWA